MNSRIRMIARIEDGRNKSSSRIASNSGDLYTVIMDRTDQSIVIKNADNVVVAQIDATGNALESIQIAKNFLISDLECDFSIDENTHEVSQTASEPEIATIQFSDVPDSGEVVFAYDGNTMSTLGADLIAEDIENDLIALDSLLKDTTVRGSIEDDMTVTFGGISSPETLEVDSNTLQIDEKDLITFDALPASGVFKITSGLDKTADIDFDATASDVQDALRAISGLESLIVTGNFEDGFLIQHYGIASPTALTVDSLDVTLKDEEDNDITVSDMVSVNKADVDVTIG